MEDIVLYGPITQTGLSSLVQKQSLTGIRKGKGLLIKIPEEAYQDMYTLAQLSEHPVEAVRSYLLDWVNTNFPGYGILAFQDYSLIEAGVLAGKTGRDITWGMYIVINEGTTGFGSELEDINKLLEDGTGNL